MKRYVLFAGVNGAGKTTLYQTNDNYLNMPRINMDEIVREFGSWRVSADASKAGMIAVRKIKEYFDSGVSFNQETTLCGHMILRNIKKAKQLGYEIDLNYVGLDSVELAKERVAIRVQNGGHGIPGEDIERQGHRVRVNTSCLRFCGIFSGISLRLTSILFSKFI